MTFINDTCMVKNTENENKICKNLKSNFRSSNASRVVKKKNEKDMSPQKMRCNIYFNKDYHFFVSKTSLRKNSMGSLFI